LGNRNTKQDILDDPGCGWCNRAERVHMRHNVMASLLFLCRRELKLLRI
jgi:hypothetical protein